MYESILAPLLPIPDLLAADRILLAWLAGNALVSTVLAMLIVALLPLRPGESRLPLFLLVFAIGYAVPLLGFLGVLIGALWSRFFRAPGKERAFRLLELPELDSYQRFGTRVRAAGLRSFLTNFEAPMASRLRALVALQNVSARVAIPLLRDALVDHSDDIRLLAYGMLDSQEKRLNRAIHAESAQFSSLPQGCPEYDVAARRLSELYWELVYQRLAQGDLRTHALEQSLRYTRIALAGNSRDAMLLLRRGRLEQELGDPQAAWSSYRQALAAGTVDKRIVPYLAEAAYRLGKYDLVRNLMAPVDNWHFIVRLRPVLDYWCKR